MHAVAGRTWYWALRHEDEQPNLGGCQPRPSINEREAASHKSDVVWPSRVAGRSRMPSILENVGDILGRKTLPKKLVGHRIARNKR
jgi:hypothetical protein